jgi:hypothetical protein
LLVSDTFDCCMEL